MATSFTEVFDQIVSHFQAAFEHSSLVRRNERPQRAIIEMQGDYGPYRIHLREIWRADGSRKYAYYVLDQAKIIAGFDNAPDPRALRLKYGADYAHHRLELIPHYHTANKQTIELTDEMDCSAFVTWLKNKIPAQKP